MDEATLTRRAAAGDRHAFGILVSRHQEGVYRWILRLVRDQETARDLTQDTFVRSFRALPAFRGDAAFGTWLRTIATNVVRSHVRRAGAVAFVPLDEELPSESASPDVELAAERERRALAAALDRLPPRQRDVVRLRIYRELSYTEIATLTGSSENAAKVNFHHAVKRLRRLLGAGFPPAPAPTLETAAPSGRTGGGVRGADAPSAAPVEDR